jgi:hypothetical protein
MRGRRPWGPEYAETLKLSELAQERLKVVLQTIAGQCRIGDACARLGISEQRFDQLREESLLAAGERLELRAAGRPVQTPSPAQDQIRLLEEKVAELEIELRVARTRAEIALVLPQVGSAAEKKTTGQPKKPRRRGRPPGSRKHT